MKYFFKKGLKAHFNKFETNYGTERIFYGDFLQPEVSILSNLEGIT